MSREPYDYEKLEEEFWKVAEQVDGAPTAKEFLELSDISTMPYVRYFGNWNNTLTHFGLDVNKRGPDPITHKDLMYDYFNILDEVGTIPTSYELDEYGNYSRETYARDFDGSFRDMHFAWIQEYGRMKDGQED